MIILKVCDIFVDWIWALNLVFNLQLVKSSNQMFLELHFFLCEMSERVKIKFTMVDLFFHLFVCRLE